MIVKLFILGMVTIALSMPFTEDAIYEYVTTTKSTHAHRAKINKNNTKTINATEDASNFCLNVSSVNMTPALIGSLCIDGKAPIVKNRKPATTTLPPTNAPMEPRCLYLKDTNVQAHGISSSYYTSVSKEVCCELCMLRMPECTAFIYHDDNCCYLKGLPIDPTGVLQPEGSLFFEQHTTTGLVVL